MAVYNDNPLFVPARDPQVVWETVADVVDDYFRIEHEDPVRCVGETITEGRLDTFPEVGSTIFEPWRHDSADPYEKLESTLQSIRRTAKLRVSPSEGGYQIEVAVYKELEDVAKPAHASAGSATFRNDSSLTRVVSPIGDQDVNQGWTPLGRDRALEQRIIGQLQQRLGVTATSPIATLGPTIQPVPAPPATLPQSLQPNGYPLNPCAPVPPPCGPQATTY